MAFNIGQCRGAAGRGAPFPQWTVISSALEGGTTGVVGKVDNGASRTLVEATAWPSRVYFFTSEQAAKDCINASGGAVSPALQKIASAGQQVTNTATGGTNQPGACCLFQFPGVAGIGSFCVLSKSEARAMIFGLLLAASGLVTFVGLAVLVAAGFERSGAGEAAGRTLETVGAGVAAVPGGQGAGLAIGSAGAAARRTGRQSLDRRRSARATQQRRTQPRPSTTARSTTARTSTTTARPSTTAPSTSARRPTEAEIRAQLRARADEISTRQEPGRG